MNRAVLHAFPLLLIASAALGATKGGSQPVSILPGGDSKKPISIEADKLDYFEKEGKAVYDGHVVVVQGESHLTCSRLTIFMEPSNAQSPTPTPAADADAAPAGADASSRLKHMDCAGPVKMVSKTQTATGENGTYDKLHDAVILSGHVVLTDGRNVTRGDRLTYDLKTGQANVQGGSSRVTGFFLPGSASGGDEKKKKK